MSEFAGEEKGPAPEREPAFRKVVSSFGFPLAVVVSIGLAMLFPAVFVEIGGFPLVKLIVPLLQIVMLGMGMTLTLADFSRVLRMPGLIVLGVSMQFAVMPFLGWALAKSFALDGALAAGVILFGSCPGGVASNVICYLARANVALSVTLSTFTTLASVVLTPLMMKWYAQAYVPIDLLQMFFSILSMILLPLAAGLALKYFFPRFVRTIIRFLPFVATLAICLIVAITIGMSRNDLMKAGFALIAVAILHNLLGFTLGYVGARLMRLNTADTRTIAFEVAMQNGGMATGIAFNVFQSKQMALCAAIEGPWGGILASLIASWYRSRPPEPVPTEARPENCPILPQTTESNP